MDWYVMCIYQKSKPKVRSFDKGSLPTLVVGVLGVSHLGNDRTGNPFFSWTNCWIARYENEDQIGARINHQVFCGAVRFSLRVITVWWTCLCSGSVG